MPSLISPLRFSTCFQRYHIASVSNFLRFKLASNLQLKKHQTLNHFDKIPCPPLFIPQNESLNIYSINFIIILLSGVTVFYSQKPTLCEAVNDGSSEPRNVVKDEKKGETDDGEDECPLCRFMKRSPCGDVFRQWQNCVDNHRESGNFPEMCSEQTINLGKCSSEHELGLFDLVEGDIDENKEGEHRNTLE